MSEFKVGDEFWVIKTYSYHSQPQSPGDIYLEKGIIGIDGDEIIGVTEYTFLSENDLEKCFRSKQEAIDAMIAGLNQLKENDFTKDELKKILLRSYSWVSYSENQNKEELKLISKIQSMIDNYCEHTPQPEHIEEIRQTMCCGQKLFYAVVNWSIAKCGNCGRKLDDN